MNVIDQLIVHWIDQHFEPAKSVYKWGARSIKEDCQYDMGSIRVRHDDFQRCMILAGYQPAIVDHSDDPHYKMKAVRKQKR
jgi:hypothetical protein